ncbi:RHS repeat domain-containing protein [Hymenobacter latericus]|uniref:RHS repeat domain-containing protein n=1 Tax=Hymenobacter sp. YIM 151858-1 TaxID=2987688 RepID=UPI0022271CB6|nr:RHS repeat-associated core domain-containing protein [Hymenobacter sp. YIM 151858-1]UYZ61206.1 hypothetical protein OIS50_19750 [Hymenobacter sp. YIM 151858-1]
MTAYVGNESQEEVYFDDVTVEHRQGLQVQETQYDPYGLELAGLNKAPTVENKYTWNGKERQDEFGLRWNDHGWRFFDAQLGRWVVVDPDAEEADQESWGTYHFGMDNAVRYNDLDGRAPGDPEVPTVAGMLYSTAAGLAVSAVNTAMFMGDMTPSGGFGMMPTKRASLGEDGRIRMYARMPATNGRELAANLGSDLLDVANVGSLVAGGGAGSVLKGGLLFAKTGGKTVVANAVAQAGKKAVKVATSGEFSISDWSGYPHGGVPKPKGPFRLLEGSDYATARTSANKANAKIHKQNPALKGKDIHEIQPVKFGGSPTDPNNKVPLTRKEHAQYTTWWNNLQKSLK